MHGFAGPHGHRKPGSRGGNRGSTRRRSVQGRPSRDSPTARSSSASMKTCAVRMSSSCSRPIRRPRIFMELLLLIDAARRASAARITCVIPYFGYRGRTARISRAWRSAPSCGEHDRESAGADRVLGIDLHEHQLQGFFDLPVDHLYAAPVLTAHYRKKQLQGSCRGRTRCRKREDGARIREAAQRLARDHRQAAAGGRMWPKW